MNAENTMKPPISVIVAVYNHFEWLRLILDALQMQTFKNFEVVIADDGSSKEIVTQIKEYIAANPGLRIVHSWQEDKGWRKDMSLNKAVKASSGDYLVFIDGDCIPHRKFVEDHYRLRLHGTATSGRRADMSRDISDEIENIHKLPRNYFSQVRLKAWRHLMSFKFGVAMAQLRRCIRFPFVFGHPLLVKNDGILGCNFGIYRDDLMVVNGFDERYLDPGTGEDTDLDVRLANAGIRHRKVSHYALMLHRNHPRLTSFSASNKALLDTAIRDKVTATPAGIVKTTSDVDNIHAS